MNLASLRRARLSRGEKGVRRQRTPQTGWLARNRNSFLTVLEAGKSEIKAPADLVSGENTLPGSWTAVFSVGQKG